MWAGSLQRGCRIVAILLAASIVLLNRSASADELTDALIRYVMRDYAQAVELLTPLAERGNAVAQLKLGIIYARGEGVRATAQPRYGGSPMPPSRASPRRNSSSAWRIATAWARR